MSDINYWLEEYRREVTQLRQQLDKLRGVVNSGNTKMSELLLLDCESKINRAKEVKKSFGLELRTVRDRSEKTQFENEGKMVDGRLDDGMSEFQKLKALSEKRQLIGNQQATTANTNRTNNFVYNTEGKDNDALLGEANRIQDLTFESLARTRGMVEASKEVGTMIVEQLQAQRTQIVEIDNELTKMDSNLERASKLVTNFTKRMATDRIIQCFAAFNIVALLGLILYVAISGKSLTAASSSSSSSKTSYGPSGVVTPTRMPTYVPSGIPSILPTESPVEQQQQLRQQQRQNQHIKYLRVQFQSRTTD
jgi:hypothetical protein